MIAVERLSYSYPESERPAVEGVQVEVESAELLLVAGDSGGGKSTLLKALNGLVPHFYGGRFEGRVIVDGTDTLGARPRDLADKIGFVGQDPEDHAVAGRVEDDIAFTLENLGLGAKTMRKRVEEVLDALGIAHLRARRLDTLSGGERQRAAVASVLAAMPSHLVLDEPTSQLDPQSAEEVISSMLRLRDEIGITIVLSEHRLERVLEYAQRLAIMEEGGAIVGEPQALLSGRTIGPPVVKLGRALGWSPLPLSLREARRRAREVSLRPLPQKDSPHTPGHTSAAGNGLEVWLDGKRALHHVDFELREGEVVALMGRNGSGKTTLLRAMAGLAATKRGTVAAPERVALVPQNPEAMLFRSTVEEEIRVTLRGRVGRADDSTLHKEAEFFGVSHLLGRYPRELSGGEKTRVAVAAACAGDPGLVLLDEPTRGLDEPGKERLLELMGLWSAAGKAVVVATHDVELAARAASRVVLLSEGEVIVDSDPHSVLASSLTFSTQMNKIFGDARILTLEDALRAAGPTVRA